MSSNKLKYLFFKYLCLYKSYISTGTVLHLHLIVQLHRRTAQVLHNIQRRLLRIHQVLYQELPITSIHLHPLQLQSVPRTHLPVQCIRHQMLLTLLPLYTAHQMLVVHNLTNHIAQVLQFTRLQIFRYQVQGK